MPIMQIRKIREDLGMAQGLLASRMGVVPAAVANWESEVALPRTRELPRLARVLGCSISELFLPDEDPDALDE